MELITTNEARCRDCYCCIRICPVKAIRIKPVEDQEVHAQVVDELCVYDGRCVSACPQNAKKIPSDLNEVKQIIASGERVTASIAPSFAAALPLPDPALLPAVLKKLGFLSVQETALGAELVIHEHRRLGYDSPLISSSCPVIVNLVEKHYPELIPMLAPIVSPMVAHGRLIKNQDPAARVVFIGPCIAKRDEIRTPQLSGAIDYILGFTELWDWMGQENIQLDTLEPIEFDGPQPNLARLFPVDGGMLRTASLNTDIMDSKVIAITGLRNCIDFFKHLAARNVESPPRLMELLACNGGCIAGPLTIPGDDIFVRRQRIINYYKSRSRRSAGERSPGRREHISLPPEQMVRHYENKKMDLSVPSEETIKDILAQTGKYTAEDQLNCGSCGYNSCRDKAVAVFHGTAELQMCIPYMRKKAESMSNRVVATMPNGVIITTRDLVIVEINPAAEQMFNCSAKDTIGKYLRELFDPGNFQRVVDSKAPINVLSNYPRYNLNTREIIFPLDREQTIVGILVDITEDQRRKEELNTVKSQTIQKAQEVIEKQMMVAQEIAGLLGETTAETKVLLSKLIKLMREEPAREYKESELG